MTSSQGKNNPEMFLVLKLSDRNCKVDIITRFPEVKKNTLT